ncbi:MAG: hypothetical protein QOH63_441 [Acidobacteriota bacterium]|jgi:hypothetical protein|nr:hypothetical protein [Acidobacteriota bacterium]
MALICRKPIISQYSILKVTLDKGNVDTLMSISTYTIHELFNLTDNRPWKLHWFEQLRLNQLTTEPLIEAQFVPLIHPDLDIEANPSELLANSSYDFSQSKKIKVGGGQLPMLHIGLMLFQGRPITRPRYQRKIFDLFIGEDTTEVLPIKHGHRPAPRSRKIYDVPYSQYHLYGTNDYVRCLHINVPPGRHDKITKIIIPCAEVIRFYYGNSSELFHEVLTNGLVGSPNRVFNSSKTVMPGTDATAFIQLSPYVKKQDAPIIARFAFDPYALTCARHIYLSAYKNATRPYKGRGDELQGYVPEARLPYVNQQTRLVVHGKEIESGTDRYFLVYYITSDSTPFPFEYFEFRQDGSDEVHTVTNQGLPDRGRNVRVEEEGGFVTVNDEAEVFIIRTDKEPSPSKEKVEELLWADKFPDLKNKKWRKQNNGSSRTLPPRREPAFIQGHDDTGELSTAPRGSGENKVTPLTFMYDFDGEEDTENVTWAEAKPDPEEVPVDGTDGEKPKETKPRRATDHSEALPASYELFKKLVSMLNEVLPAKLQCDFVRVPKTGEEKTFGQPLVTFFPTKWQFQPLRGDQTLSWSIVTRDGKTRERRLAVARGVCQGEHYFYLMEIEPSEHGEQKEHKASRKRGKTLKPRGYTLLLIYDESQDFADMSSENLREVLAFCARNAGSWLKKKELKDFGRYKFKHASKFEKVFVSRIIEQLSEAGLLTLTKGEVTKWVREPKRLKAPKLPNAGDSSQDVEPSRTDEPASRIILSSQSPEVEQASQTDQATNVTISSEGGESSGSNEMSDSNRSSDAEPSSEETS